MKFYDCDHANLGIDLNWIGINKIAASSGLDLGTPIGMCSLSQKTHWFKILKIETDPQGTEEDLNQG